MTSFSELNLSESLVKGLTALEYHDMTPIQATALPLILAGRDVIAQAQTGSGKTAAFALGLLHQLDTTVVRLHGLVLCPTRELADQVSKEIRRIARPLPNVKVLTLCGGVPLRPHLASLAHEPHIVVGTPGRILELIRKQALPLKALQILVLDEADRMLDMGFAADIDAIVKAAPQQRQTLLFSATYPEQTRAIAERHLRDPETVTIDNGDSGPDIEQRLYEVADGSRKLDALVDLLVTQRPESAIVFCNTRNDTRDVAESLDRCGFSVLALHGELDQRERDEMLVRFANRSCTVLVATDVAARGLDIKELPLVVNYDVASDADAHIHRIGRTGRAGARGLAITLMTPREAARISAIAERMGQALIRQPLPQVNGKPRPLLSAYLTIAVDGGRTDKLRPGDLLGALTGDAGLPGDAVGKIDIFPTRSYVAIARNHADSALKRLRDGKIKGRNFRVRPIGH
ncbi:MAG: ATP-dependent RNA helicase DbpA [Rhodanobacteraceae bacterium]|nr:ATP-dependent RNA helicase DbpA [Rhodanobacteraceae bacterium]